MRFVTLNAAHDLTALPGEVLNYGVSRKLEHIPGYVKLRGKFDGYHAPSWQFDIARACDRLYALLDAAETGVVVWIDPALRIVKTPPESAFTNALAGAYAALYRRNGMPAKTDVAIINADHIQHAAFKAYVLQVIDEQQFETLTYWTDGAILEACLKAFEGLRVADMSGEHGNDKEPIRRTALGEYFDF